MQMWLNDKFMDSIFCRRKLVIHHMLRRGAHAHYPSQQIINDAFIHLVTNNDFSTASLLMQQDLHGVNEAGFNLAFHELFAYREVDYDALDWLLSGRQGFSVQQEAIDSCLLQLIHISLFRKHSYHHQRHHPYTQQHTSAVSDNVISRLSCRASEETRQMIIAQKAKKAAEEKAPHVFRHEQSMDIHAFSAVEIPHPPSASAAAEDQGRSAGQMVTRNTLNAACLDVMKRRIANYREMNADEVLQSLTQLITQYLHPNQYDRAMEIIGNVVSTHTIKVLSLALQFLSSFSSEAASVWIQGFLNESIVERSCQAGAVERIVTGLRGVGDAELNSLFSNAEGVHLARIFLKTKFNIFESTTEGAAIAQQNSEELAWILVSNGFRDESSNMGMAQRILTDYAMNCIRSYGVEYVQLSGEVDSVIEVIMDTYDTHLKAYVLAASSSTAAMHEDDDKQQVDEAKKNHNEYK